MTDNQAAQELKDQYRAISLQRQTRRDALGKAFCANLMSIVSDMHYRMTGERLTEDEHGYKGNKS